MVLDVAAVDPRCAAACIDRPTVVIVGRCNAGVGGQAEVGGSAVLRAVAVIDDDALIRISRSNCGAGRRGGLNEGISTACCVCNRLRFFLILIGKAAVLAIVRSNEQKGIIAGAAGSAGMKAVGALTKFAVTSTTL